VEKIKMPYHFVSADAIAASNTAWLEQQWEAARLKMDGMAASEFLLVIDEIQKIENWSETVKRLWDTRTKRGLKLILLGSSRQLLQRGPTESLAGRVDRTDMGHWTFSEMEPAFGWTGGPVRVVWRLSWFEWIN
jgi:hypothetical protein